jgi:hypothetical protein
MSHTVSIEGKPTGTHAKIKAALRAAEVEYAYSNRVFTYASDDEALVASIEAIGVTFEAPAVVLEAPGMHPATELPWPEPSAFVPPKPGIEPVLAEIPGETDEEWNTRLFDKSEELREEEEPEPEPPSAPAWTIEVGGKTLEAHGHTCPPASVFGSRAGAACTVRDADGVVADTWQP